jgi:hypothetical protein
MQIPTCASIYRDNAVAVEKLQAQEHRGVLPFPALLAGTTKRAWPFLLVEEAAMDDRPNSTPGTLAKFHLGLAADGSSCALVFVDENQNSIACILEFADLEHFIGSLKDAAREMTRRRGAAQGVQPQEINAVANTLTGAIDVASTDFQLCDEDGTIIGSLVGDGGQVVGIRLKPHVANEMTRNMLLSTRAIGTC